ncbi:MAG: hypothetical protein EBY18_16915 [Alphaproteobacteria bacterium]|nr:hypothetical protein [Alphaproteobacteria bacterium]
MSAKFRIGGVVVAFLALFWPGLSAAQGPAACPADATALADGAKLSCICAAGTSGGVYGSDRYTADSAICTAAVHAGRIAAGVRPHHPGLRRRDGGCSRRLAGSSVIVPVLHHPVGQEQAG